MATRIVARVFDIIVFIVFTGYSNISVVSEAALTTSDVSRVTVYVGDSVNFSCQSNETNAPLRWMHYDIVDGSMTFTWIHNGQMISPTFSDRFSVTFNNETREGILSIHDTRLKDAGMYNCSEAFSPRTALTFVLTVANKNDATSSNPVTYVAINSSVTFICQMNSSDTVRWEHNPQTSKKLIIVYNGVKLNQQFEQRYSIATDTNLNQCNLTIHRVQYSDTGNFTCSGTAAHTEKKFILNVRCANCDRQYKKDAGNSSEVVSSGSDYRSVEAHIGDSVTLLCRSKAWNDTRWEFRPSSSKTVTVVYNRHYIHRDLVERYSARFDNVSEEHRLTINNVQPSDTGTFKCYTSRTTQIFVQINFTVIAKRSASTVGETTVLANSSVSEIGNITYLSHVGQEVTFTCRLRVPGHQLRWKFVRWKSDYVWIYNGRHFSRSYANRSLVSANSTTSESNLTVHLLKLDDSGTYICSTDNTAGETKTFHLVVGVTVTTTTELSLVADDSSATEPAARVFTEVPLTTTKELSSATDESSINEPAARVFAGSAKSSTECVMSRFGMLIPAMLALNQMLC